MTHIHIKSNGNAGGYYKDNDTETCLPTDKRACNFQVALISGNTHHIVECPSYQEAKNHQKRLGGIIMWECKS